MEISLSKNTIIANQKPDLQKILETTAKECSTTLTTEELGDINSKDNSLAMLQVWIKERKPFDPKLLKEFKRRASSAILGHLRNNEYLIANIDILGFKDKINESSFTQNCIEFMSYVSSVWATSMQEIENMLETEFLTYNIVNDAIFLICPANNPTQLFEELRNFTLGAFARDILVRGAITIGSCYYERNLFYGEGIVRAYELQEKWAKYPRIIFDNERKNNKYWDGIKQYFIEDSVDNRFIYNWIPMINNTSFLKSELVPIKFKNSTVSYIKNKIRVLEKERDKKNEGEVIKKYNYLLYQLQEYLHKLLNNHS